MNTSKTLRIAVIAEDGFEQSELDVPVATFREAGAEVDIISPSEESEIQGFNHEEKKDKVRVDKKLSEADLENYDAIHLPGGTLNADSIRQNKKLQAVLKKFNSEGKLIGAICHAPWALVSADLLRGRTITSWPSLKDDIENAGGRWVDQEVVEDENFVTSRKPDDLEAYCDRFLKRAAA